MRNHALKAGPNWLILLVIASLAVAGGAAQSPPSTRPSTRPAPATKPQDSLPAREHVLMTTSKGEIVIELDREHAPVSVENFLAYVDAKFYDGTIFHRVIPGFMIQGGGFTADMTEKPTNKGIANEWKNGLKNARGTIAMARRGGDPNSATSQFFINVADHGMLDRAQSDGAGYAVFGKVTAGMDVVDQIKAVQTGNRGQHQNVPVETVTIESVRRITAEEAEKKIEAAPPARGGSTTRPGSTDRRTDNPGGG